MFPDQPVRIAVQVSEEDAVYALPDDRRLLGDVLRLARDLRPVRVQILLHEHLLLQEVLEGMPPIQPLEAGCERGRVTHQNNDLEIEVSREPVAGERRDRILDDQAATSERREPVLWLVLEEDLPRTPPEDLVEGFQGSVLRQSWRVGEPVFCEAIERVGPGLDVERLVCYQGILSER